MGTAPRLDIYLVRHGVTRWNKEKRYLGHTDEPCMKERLDDLADLKSEMAGMEFDQVWTSDLLRCRETLHYLMPGVHPVTDKRLRECDFGNWEGKTYEDLKNLKDYRRWIDHPQLQPIPAGESWREFSGRLDEWLNDLLAGQEGVAAGRKTRALAVTHGGVIRYLVSVFRRSESFWHVTIRHGQALYLKLIYEGGKWTCNSLQAVPSAEKEEL
ncbi:histidine phosphatase family protein [Salipaludibacillus aurantiacus]|uniref:Alpha-ribazole phosphatase n=1 Tax=Salipaludibacillus aurantiacus TaxID=1601833 RepID=A0A1H9SE55_9BACI|nr:histidine phosphatase family protein [Salipaludibacillus aurantiacus]SER83326.1 alpha-ribazole phosphatase [Salipaludibacillus aurantiacus]